MDRFDGGRNFLFFPFDLITVLASVSAHGDIIRRGELIIFLALRLPILLTLGSNSCAIFDIPFSLPPFSYLVFRSSRNINSILYPQRGACAREAKKDGKGWTECFEARERGRERKGKEVGSGGGKERGFEEI